MTGKTEFIVDGTREKGYDAVVLVFNVRGGGMCTGSLIADRVVLTAKHCVQSPGASGPQSPGNITVGVGSQFGYSSDMDYYGVVDVVTTPGGYDSSATAGVTGLDGNDVAVITLRTSPGIATIPPNLDSPVPYEGEPATAVGFGQTPRGQTGVKYRTGTVIERVTDKYLVVEGTVCQGDSGGPLITEEGEVIGVVSVGTGRTCGTGTSFYNRIDLYKDMILTAVARSSDCSNDGPEACDGFDNDCDDLVDEDCLDVGEACKDDAECVTRRCERTPSGRICTTSCDPLRPFSGCPDGMYCANAGDCQGVCMPGSVGDKSFGEACEENADCRSLFCSDPGDGQKRCLTACRGDSDGCLAGEACVAAADACGSCVDEGLISDSSKLGLGEPCDGDARCRSGACASDGDVRYCTARCQQESDCGQAMHCRGGLCIRGERQGLGGPCVEAEDCEAGQFCLHDPDRGSYCSRTCGADSPCGDGFVCTEVTGGAACLPERSAPGGPCQADADCVTELCHTPSGTCSRLCTDNSACWAGTECHRQGGSADGLCLKPEQADKGDVALDPGDGSGGGGAPADKGGDAGSGGGSSSGGGCSFLPGATAPWLAWLPALLSVALWRRRRA